MRFVKRIKICKKSYWLTCFFHQSALVKRSRRKQAKRFRDLLSKKQVIVHLSCRIANDQEVKTDKAEGTSLLQSGKNNSILRIFKQIKIRLEIYRSALFIDFR